MKATRSAKRFVRIRRAVICIAAIGMIVPAITIGETLAMRVQQNTAPHAMAVPVANGSLADLMAATR